MSLIDQNQINSIKDAIQQVTDTFFVTPVLYKLGVSSLDRFQEDKTFSYKDYNLKALVEYSNIETDMSKETEQGGSNVQKIKCSFNYRDIKAAGLADANNYVIMNAAKDFMIINGKHWKVRYVGLDGPLEAEQVLLIVKGDLEENKTE